MEYLNIIQKTFPEVGGTRADGEFYTGDGKKVDVSDEIKIKARAEADQEYEAQEYARKRQAEYPDWGTQLNKIYDDGLTKWKTEMVDPIKAKYPKP